MNKSSLNIPGGKVSLGELLQVLKRYDRNKWIIGKQCGESESESESEVVSDSLRPHGLTVAYQAPLSMGFSRQEYWSGLPFPSPGDLPNPGIEPGSPAL